MKKAIVLALFIIGVLGTLCSKNSTPLYPVINDSVFVHGRWHNDGYSWLEDVDNPNVKRILKQERKYCSDMLKPSAQIAKTVYKEFVSRLVETETTQPYYYKEYYYYTRTEKGKPFSIHCRKLFSLDSPEQIILDENKLAKGKKYFSIGAFSISPDQKLLAYSVDYKGDEIYRLYIKDLHTGKTIETKFDNVSEALWMADNLTLLITTMNDRLQTDTLIKWHLLAKQHTVLYQEKDPARDISIYHSTEEKKVFLSSESKNTSDIYYLANNDPEELPVLLIPHKDNVQIYPDFYDNKFYVWISSENGDSRIGYINQSDISKSFNEIYKSSSANPVSSFLVMDKQIALIQREMGFETLVVIDRLSGKITNKIIPEEPSDLSFWINPNPRADKLFYTIESEISPLSIMSYDLSNQKQEVVRVYAPGGIYDKTDYTTVVKWVKSPDGTAIPLTMTYMTAVDFTKPQIVKLSGYGAYGDCNDPYFSSASLSYLDRNIILATAHIRGGGEFGKQWYDAGRMLNKKISFTDFIACIDYLIDEGFTTKDKLIIEGGSAGGLLMGAVNNQAFDKCALVIADVPFVDLINTMLDDTLPLTIQEYEEWGNPNDNVYFDYMLSYSPIDNIKPSPYPTMLITAAINDTRVGYWEAVKWAAKLRAHNTGQNPIILKINTDEGHTGQVDRYKSLKSYADTVGFVIWKMMQ